MEMIQVFYLLFATKKPCKIPLQRRVSVTNRLHTRAPLTSPSNLKIISPRRFHPFSMARTPQWCAASLSLLQFWHTFTPMTCCQWAVGFRSQRIASRLEGLKSNATDHHCWNRPPPSCVNRIDLLCEKGFAVCDGVGFRVKVLAVKSTVMEGILLWLVHISNSSTMF